MKTLIYNTSVFDGIHSDIKENTCVVIEDRLVAEITDKPGDLAYYDKVIDGTGLTAMPGMSDSHVHLGSSAPAGIFETLRVDELAIRSTVFAKEMLERGFTNVRDAGGVVYGLKASIDCGIVPGPRIFPSHAMISQTCGHADMRTSRAEIRNANGEILAPQMQHGGMVLADGVPEVMRAVRDQLFLGASQIKIMAGGGLSSKFDHLLTVQYTYEELKAAVDCASDYGTYVMAHIYSDDCMKRAAKAGVKSFEHATLMSEDTAKLIRDHGIWVCPCPQFGSAHPRQGSSAPKASGHQIPIEDMIAAENNATELILKYDIPILFGTDAASDPKYVENRQHNDILLYKNRFGSHKTLCALTGNVYELSKLCTYQHPYPDGKVGLLETGAYADLLLVLGNPEKDVAVLCDKNNIKFVMKDGVVYKDTISN